MHLRTGNCAEVLFLPGGDLLTYNDLGLCRWPLTYEAGGRLRFGPAEPLALIGQGGGYERNRLASAAATTGAPSGRNRSAATWNSAI